MKPGETVLDLGSGGGIDVLLSARRVGPTGKAYGLDMTDEMLALARENQKKAGVENVEFLKGEIENIPLPDNSVDVIISNCVINLSGDKDRVLQRSVPRAEAGRPLRGVRRRDARRSPRANPQEHAAWVGCIAGALERREYGAKLADAGFEAIGIEPTRIYKVEDAREFLSGKGIDVDAMARQIDGKFMSAFVRATKPAKCFQPGCAPTCCGSEHIMKLYMFEHCSLCFRVRMAAALKGLHLQEIPVLDDDTETMTKLVGKRVIPILIKNNGTNPCSKAWIWSDTSKRQGEPLFCGSGTLPRSPPGPKR